MTLPTYLPSSTAEIPDLTLISLNTSPECTSTLETDMLGLAASTISQPFVPANLEAIYADMVGIAGMCIG